MGGVGEWVGWENEWGRCMDDIQVAHVSSCIGL